MYTLCSSSLIVVNKKALHTCQAPALLLLCQCTSSATALSLTQSERGTCRPVQPLKGEEKDRFIVVIVSFILTLFANMKSLERVNVDTVVSLRMTAPLALSFMDHIFLGRKLPSLRSLVSLLGISLSFFSFLSAAVKAKTEDSAHVWLSVWYIGLLFESVYVKYMVSNTSLTTASQSFYQNALAIPCLICIALFTNEIEVVCKYEWNFFDITVLGVSCLLGLGMSYFSFALRSEISSTSFSMVGNGCKLLTIALNALIWDKHSSSTGTISVLLAIFCSMFYSQAPLMTDCDRRSQHWSYSWIQSHRPSVTLTVQRNVAIGIMTIFLASLWLESSDGVGLFAQPFLTVHQHSISGVSGSVFEGAKTRQFQKKLTHKFQKYELSAFTDEKYAHCSFWAVCTTIFNASDAVRDVCERLPSYCLIVIADRKGPDVYQVGGDCTFLYLTVQMQERLAKASHFAATVPWNHFARKNIGYLFALANGAKRVWDFDDDNILLTSDYMLESQIELTNGLLIPQTKEVTMNPYPVLGSEEFSWPRGFPLAYIKDKAKLLTDKTVFSADFDKNKMQVAIVQGLANGDPDVDAIYRLQRELPFDFRGWSKQAKTFVVPSTAFIPWNAQATLFTLREVLWAMYLPLSVHGRVSDIWRSFIVQRLLRDTPYRTAFAAKPLVQQERNIHSYMADFDAEYDLYHKSGALINFLDSWKPRNDVFSLRANIIELYIDLYERNYIELADVEMIELWLVELDLINYSFPEIPRSIST